MLWSQPHCKKGFDLNLVHVNSQVPMRASRTRSGGYNWQGDDLLDAERLLKAGTSFYFDRNAPCYYMTGVIQRLSIS